MGLKNFFFIFFILNFVLAGFLWDEPYLPKTNINYWLLTYGKDVYYLTNDGFVYSFSPLSKREQVIYSTYRPSSTPMVIAKNNLIFADKDGVVYAYSLLNKKISWKFEPKGELNLSKIKFLDASEYALAIVYENRLVVLKPDNGLELFSREIENGLKVKVQGNKIFLNTAKNLEVYEANGRLSWRAEIGEVYHQAVYDEERNNVYVASANKGILFAFSLTTGQLLWYYQTKGFLMFEPVFSSNTILIVDNKGQAIGLDKNQGNVLYIKNINSPSWSKPAKINNYAFFGNLDEELIGIDIDSGEVLLRQKLEGRADYPLILDNKTMIVYTTKNRMYYIEFDPFCSIISPQDGEEIGLYNKIEGAVFSLNGIKAISIDVNKKNIINEGINGKYFEKEIDFSSEAMGLVDIDCKATNLQGRIERNVLGYKTRALLNLNKEKTKLYAYIEPSLNLNPGQEFVLYVQDKNAKDLEEFVIKYKNESKTSNSPIKLKAPLEPGIYTIAVKKVGYDEKVIKFEVKDNLLVVKIFGILVVLILLILFIIKTKKK